MLTIKIIKGKDCSGEHKHSIDGYIIAASHWPHNFCTPKVLLLSIDFTWPDLVQGLIN